MQRVWVEKCVLGFRWGDLSDKGHQEDLGLDRRIILSWIFKK